MKQSVGQRHSAEFVQVDQAQELPLLTTPASTIAEAVKSLDLSLDDEAFEDECARVQGIFGDHHLLWSTRVRRLIQLKRLGEAAELASGRKIDEFDDVALIAQAELLHDARAYDAAEQIFMRLLQADPLRRDVRTAYAKRLFADGLLIKAHDLLTVVSGSLPEGSKSRALFEKADALRALLSRLEGAIDPEADARILAMKHAILYFRDRTPAERSSTGLGRLTLVTGGLGSGGAERQLTRLAIELERARKASGEIAGISLERPVEVVVRSYTGEKQNFYLPEMLESGVELRQINDMQPVSAKALGVEDPDLLLLLDFLPPSVNFGVKRLSRYLRDSGTETLSAWQDGACLFAGLAALIAGVPQVQLAIRGLPPSMRRHMFRPEYEVLYRAMAEVPGVTFLSNNLTAARAYAEWLDIPINRFAIVYNGVEPMRTEGHPSCEQAWQRFVAATPDAECTIGGVFRFDTDKQPTLWIRFAARFLKKYPKSRILLVGGGRLLPKAIELATELGIADRILFTDRSDRVGFWMTKMDVAVLMSRYEGLPNVLIEAQYMGLRVITTPAGGAAECLIEGKTGHVLDCAEKPDLDRAAELTKSLADQSADRTIFQEGGFAFEFLQSRFSIPHMLAQYVTCTKRGLGSDLPALTKTVEEDRAAA